MISVIVPVYNCEKYLEQCLNSLKEQTYQKIQIICINDGSTDNSLNILNNFLEQDNRFKIVTTDNNGQSAARNEALKYVTGEYVTFVDADDWLETDCLEIALRKLEEAQADIAMWGYIKEAPSCSAHVCLYDNDKVIKDIDCKKLHIRMLAPTGNELKKPHLFDSFNTVCGKLYKVELFSNCRFHDIRDIGSGEDALLNQLIFKKTQCVVYISNIFYHYRRNINSTTNTYRHNLLDQQLRLASLMLANYKDSEFKNLVNQAYNNRIAFLIIPLSLNILKSNKNILKKIGDIHKILHSEWYKNSINSIQLRSMPTHWKFLFLCAKKRFTLSIFALMVIMSHLR